MPDFSIPYLLTAYGQTDPDLEKHVDLLKIELDHYIYCHGHHFKFSKEDYKRNRKTFFDQLYKLYVLYSVLLKKPQDKNGKPNVLSLIYFNNFKEILAQTGLNVFSPYWTPVGKNIIGNRSIYRQVNYFNESFRSKPFHSIVSTGFQEEVRKFEENVFTFFQAKNLQALFLFTDQYFYSKIAINAFKKLQRPSFILSHGLPGMYNQQAENRSDYLLVWGDKIKENYISAGFNEKKIIIAGHPAYKQQKANMELRFDLSNILVIGKAMSQHQHTYDPVLTDRGNLILYLLQIKRVLIGLGVKKARLRPHPTMNPQWFLDFLGTDFFIIDKLPLQQSLSKASLVIGPTSTLLIESVLSGVNYLAFEPQEKGKDLAGFNVVPPFDGSDKYIPVAKTEGELKMFLINKEKNNPVFLKEYLAHFDISFVKTLI